MKCPYCGWETIIDGKCVRCQAEVKVVEEPTKETKETKIVKEKSNGN